MPTLTKKLVSRSPELRCRRLSFVASLPARGRVRVVLVLWLCGMLSAGAGPTLAKAADPVLATVGDIACAPGDTTDACKQSATAKLVAGHAHTAVAVLGDDQYQGGLLSEFDGPGAYNATWGQFNPIVHPVPGNHEYADSSTAAGYFSYFGGAAVGPGGAAAEGPNGSYSYDLGSWHLIALNSNCSNVCSDSVKGTTNNAEVSWLSSDLAAHPGKCTLAYWHHPRFSSGSLGDSPGVAPFWSALYATHADIVLNGHDHVYERYAQQDPSRSATVNGIREFVVGTGGESLFALGSGGAEPTLRSFDSRNFGVLFLTLHAASYDWKFVATNGKTIDSGSTACHEPRLTFFASVRHASLGSLRKHGLTVNFYCSRACHVDITARVRRGRRMVTIARYRATDSRLRASSTHVVLQGLWQPLRRLHVAFLQLTFVAHDAANHRIIVSKTTILRR
jgi:acid phosphatase type 7